MTTLIGFLPFLVFAVLTGMTGPTYALIAGAAVSAVFIARGYREGASLKLLEVGTFVLFVAVAIWSAAAPGTLSTAGVRLCVNGGLFAIVMITIIARRPFTLEYAKEQVPPEYWNHPAFLRTNHVISSVWALAFFVMAGADAMLLLLPDLPRAVGIVTIIVAMIGAAAFTRWYAALSRTRARRAANAAPR